MNRLGITILSVFVREEAVSSVTAMSAYELADQMNGAYRADSIYKKLVELMKSGYVRHGCKDGKANTYCITEKGQKFLEDARKAG